MAEKRTTYKIQDIEGIGEVQIADEVVTIIAGLAATEVDGVASMAGNITNELVSKLGMKNLSKGVKVEIVDSVVSVDLTLNIEYGMNILETSKKVQEKVKAAIENMTGLEVADVNIHRSASLITPPSRVLNGLPSLPFIVPKPMKSNTTSSPAIPDFLAALKNCS